MIDLTKWKINKDFPQLYCGQECQGMAEKWTPEEKRYRAFRGAGGSQKMEDYVKERRPGWERKHNYKLARVGEEEL